MDWAKHARLSHHSLSLASGSFSMKKIPIAMALLEQIQEPKVG
jgi:hypothetical protein